MGYDGGRLARRSRAATTEQRQTHLEWRWGHKAKTQYGGGDDADHGGSRHRRWLSAATAGVGGVWWRAEGEDTYGGGDDTKPRFTFVLFIPFF